MTEMNEMNEITEMINEFGREEKRNSQLLVLVSQEYNYPDQSRNSVGEDDKLIQLVSCGIVQQDIFHCTKTISSVAS